MFSKKKIEDQFDKIDNSDDISQKAPLLKKQIDYFKSQKPDLDYDYKKFISLIEEFQTSSNYEYNLLWLQLINEIIRLNPSMKKKYFKLLMKIIFLQVNDTKEMNNENEEKKEEIYKIKINALSFLTKNCEEIFECDNYFQNLNHLKSLLNFFIIELLPFYYNKENNTLLLMILNLFLNINKNIENKKYLKSNYFSVIFNLLIEILCFQSLYYSFKILDIKTKKSKKNSSLNPAFTNNMDTMFDLDISINSDKSDEKNSISNFIENTTKNKLLDLIDKGNILFNIYLNLNGKNNLNIIINYQILMKIFIIHCIESIYNEQNCIEWFKLIINNFKMNKILKMITESFDDEIFDLFYVNENGSEEEKNGSSLPLMSGINSSRNKKLKSINKFFYLSEYRTKESESKNYYNNFIMKFNGLRNKLLENKEYINNGLFILINLLLNDILSKNNNSINFEEEIIIITLIKCVMKYIIKTNILEMQDNNINNIDNFVNLLIDRFGVTLSEKIWKELMVLIKYYYFELSKNKNKLGIDQIKRILKKMLKLKINGNYKFDENLFYDILNKVCDNKNKNNQINDYVLYSVYIKNKFKNSIYFDKNIFNCSEFFINLIKEKYNSFEINDSNDLIKGRKNNYKSEEEIIDTLASYLLEYLNTYSKYENKKIELFLYKNFIHLNFYFTTKKNLQSQYIKLIIKNLNNTNDLNYYQCLISYLISLHANQTNYSNKKDKFEQTLNLYKKIIIKLIEKLSETNQIQKLDYLFESIFNKLYASLSDDIEYNFLKNILEVFSCTYITKYDEILIIKKPLYNNKIDYINDKYLNKGNNNYTSIIVGNNKKYSKKVGEQWCLVDIKELFSILIKLLKKNNINIEYKEKIINFIKEKITDIFFFNKMDIDAFIDYVFDLDKDNLKQYISFMENGNTIMSINEILQNLAYLLIYQKRLFDIKDYKETYNKIIRYAIDKINYIKKIIRLIINKYELKIVKNKSSKHFVFMRNLLGIDKEGMPNIDNLKLDATDFKFNKKDKEKNINYQLFLNEDIQIDKFVYPKKNFAELIKYFKSYIHILEISLNSLSYIFIKNFSKTNTSFTKEIEEKKINIHFDNEAKDYFIHNENTNSLSKYKKVNKSLSKELLLKNEAICEQIFNILNKFPFIIKYNNSFLIEFYKLFMYIKDFLVPCGEKYIIKTILILFNISFPEYYNQIFIHLNNEFKNKYNDGKDFFLDKIETIQINKNINGQLDNNINNINNKDESKRRNTLKKINSSSRVLSSGNNLQKNKLETNDPNKYTFNQFHSRSVVVLNENIGIESVARNASIDETNIDSFLTSETNNINYNIIKKSKDKKDEYEQSSANTIILLQKLIIEYMIKSKNSLKIYNIIKNIICQNNNDENDIFLLLCKWKIVNKDNINRNEDINVFKSKRKIKNYFGGGIHNISIENFYPNKTISIKTPISNTNYTINNDYKKIPYKNMNKIIMKSIIPEVQCEEVESILNKKHIQENKKINSSKKDKYIKKDSNTFCFASSPNIGLNEIKELENEDKDNFTDSDNEKNNNEDNNNNNEINNDDDKYIDNDDKNTPNLEELISIMHNKTKNDLYKYYSNNINDINNISHQIYNIDKSFLYNEIEINVMYIIDNNDKKSLENFHNSQFIKFLKTLTMQEEENTLMKVNEPNEFIYTDNFNISKYILNNNEINNNNNSNNYQIYIIFNNTLENRTTNDDSLIMNIDVMSSYEQAYLYIFIIPISDEFWKIEFRINSKKKDEYAFRLKYLLENNFLNSYILSIRNDFSYIVYHLKLLFSLLQDLMCNIKKDLNDKKLLNKLRGIHNEEILKRMKIFKSINL